VIDQGAQLRAGLGAARDRNRSRWVPVDLTTKTQRAQSDRHMRIRRASIAAAAIASAVAFAAPASADPDTDFTNELHTYGIYGQKDRNAWIGKITCKRLYNGIDQDADKSAKFVFLQLEKGSTTEQAWQFLGAALRTYCPELLPILKGAARQ
jgi:hypothetical protein